VVGDLLVQPRLNRIEQSPIQNGGLLALENFAFERDFADIEAWFAGSVSGSLSLPWKIAFPDGESGLR
jgi:hypothetical protein